MARPAVLQYLKHGKALCGKVFAGFVETFNHLVSFSSNLKGDADLPGAKFGIRVDRSNPDNPILRLISPPAAGGGGEGSGIEDIRLSKNEKGETWIQALIDGEWVDKIPTIKHSEV